MNGGAMLATVTIAPRAGGGGGGGLGLELAVSTGAGDGTNSSDVDAAKKFVTSICALGAKNCICRSTRLGCPRGVPSEPPKMLTKRWHTGCMYSDPPVSSTSLIVGDKYSTTDN